MSKRVVVLSGCSGSGKSTVAKNLADKHYAVVSADDFFTLSGKYNFNPSHLGLAHASCFRRFIIAMQDSVELIIVDNTSTTLDECSPYMLGAAAFGYESEIITVQVHPLDLEKCAARNAHGVPLNVIRSQWGRIQNRKLPNYWKATTVPAVF